MTNYPACTVCGTAVLCGQGMSHYSCRPRCETCGQPEGICTTRCTRANRANPCANTERQSA